MPINCDVGVPRSGEKWHLDEVFITINKERHYLLYRSTVFWTP
jgi:transposase-like protein